MYRLHPRIALGALAFLLAACGASTQVSTQSPPTNRISAVAAPTAAFDLAPQKSFDQKILNDNDLWNAAVVAATPVTEPAPPPPTPKKAAAVAPAAAPEPAPDPEPASVPSGGSVEDAVRFYFGDVFDKAWRVSECESHHDPSAVSSGGGNWGLFQINTVHKEAFTDVTGQPWSAVLDPWFNSQYARSLYDSSGGWGPWTCRYA